MIKDDKKEEVLKRFKKALTNYSEMYSEQYEFTQKQLEFASGDMWEDSVASARIRDNRPMVTTNLTKPYANRIINPIRKSPLRPEIKLEDPQATEIVMGKIRDIDICSRSKEAVECAHETQVIGGIGFMRVFTDYKDNENLEQSVFIGKVDNPSQCYLGIHEEIDGSDARDGGYFTYVKEEVASEKWGEDVVKGVTSSDIDIYTSWTIPQGSVMDATYYELKETTKWRYFLIDGSFLDEIPEEVTKEEFLNATTETGEPIVVNKRRVSVTTTECYRIVGNDVVEHQTLPITNIPIVPVYGDKLFLEATENKKWCGVSYWLWDSQRTLNYYKSNELELVSKSPKTPIMMAEGQDEGHEDDWDNLNTSSIPRITYKPTTLGGQPVPPPKRMDNQAYTGGLSQSMIQVSQDMGAQIGINDGMMGMAQGANEASGAVFQRNTQGELATIQYADNLEQSMTHVYRIVLQLLPYVGDTPQKHAIRDEKGNREFQEVDFSQILTKEVLKDAEVSIKGGSMRESQRRADTQSVLEMMQLFPEKMQEGNIAPLLVEMLDVENSEKFIQALGGGDDAPDPEAMMALQEAEATIEEQEQMLTQAEEHIKQMNNYIIAQEQERENELVMKQIDAETKLATVELQNEGKVEVELIKQVGSAESQDKDIAQETRKNVVEIVNKTIEKNNSILEDRELTENDNIGMPSIVTSSPDIQIEVETE